MLASSPSSHAADNLVGPDKGVKPGYGSLKSNPAFHQPKQKKSPTPSEKADSPIDPMDKTSADTATPSPRFTEGERQRWPQRLNASVRSSSSGIMTRRRRSVSRQSRSLSASDSHGSPAGSPRISKKKKETKEPTTKNLPHYRPTHLSEHTSLLSRDKPADAPLSFEGFRNLAMIVLVFANLRLMVENYLKYGFIRSVYQLGFSKSDLKVAGLLTAAIPCHLFFSLLVERFAISELRKKKKSSVVHEKHLWRLFAALHALNALLAFVITSVFVYTSIFNPLLGTLCEVHSLILGLKVVSYALTNRDLRDAYLTNSSAFSKTESKSTGTDSKSGSKLTAKSSGSDAKAAATKEKEQESAAAQFPPIPEIYKNVPYPENLTVSNLVYFWWAPTLVYQPDYPRSPSIRPMFLLRQVLELIGTIVAIMFLSGQYAMPILKGSLAQMHEWNLITMGERLMKLAGVSIVIWLLGFFAVFQSSLNILAELMRFGDREFYQDWWNCQSVGSYWKLWNKPVNNYFVRHLYIPMLKLGWPQFQSSVMVFVVSAVLHEILVGIPTHNVIGVAFLSMMMQIPLVVVTAPLEKMGSPVGNCIFWLSFFLGQPLGVMLYYLAWNLKFNQPTSL